VTTSERRTIGPPTTGCPSRRRRVPCSPRRAPLAQAPRGSGTVEGRERPPPGERDALVPRSTAPTRSTPRAHSCGSVPTTARCESTTSRRKGRRPPQRAGVSCERVCRRSWRRLKRIVETDLRPGALRLAKHAPPREPGRRRVARRTARRASSSRHGRRASSLHVRADRLGRGQFAEAPARPRDTAISLARRAHRLGRARPRRVEASVGVAVADSVTRSSRSLARASAPACVSSMSELTATRSRLRAPHAARDHSLVLRPCVASVTGFRRAEEPDGSGSASGAGLAGSDPVLRPRDRSRRRACPDPFAPPCRPVRRRGPRLPTRRDGASGSSGSRERNAQTTRAARSRAARPTTSARRSPRSEPAARRSVRSCDDDLPSRPQARRRPRFPRRARVRA